MRPSLRVVVVALALLLATSAVGLVGDAAIPQQSSADLFQRALIIERADGRLEEAIDMYRRVLETATADRSLRADALLRIGACYEKLGRQEARAAYARLVDEFADQATAAAEARARLEALGASDTDGASDPAEDRADGMLSDHPLPDVVLATDQEIVTPFRLSPDGRRLLFLGVGNQTGELNIGVYEYEGETTTWLTHHSYTSPGNPRGVAAVWSPDGSQVAFSTVNAPPGASTGLAEIQVGRPGEPPRRLYGTENATVHVTDWLRDGSALVVEVQRQDQSVSLGLVSLSDGTFRQLRTLTWVTITNPTASPDGRYILYEDGSSDARDVYLLTTDGTEQVRIDDHPALDTQPLFSPDGRHVVFQSNRGGRKALWAVPIENGRPVGQPFSVTELAQGANLLHWSGRGIAYFAVNYASDVFTAPIDTEAGALTAEPTMVPFAKTGANRAPRWSPDGRYLGFLRARHLVLLPLDGTRPVELPVPDDAFYRASNLRWKPDGSELSLMSRDRQNRPILLRLAVADRQWTVQALPEHLSGNGMDWAPSWNELFFYNAGDPAYSLMRADLDTGRQDVVWQPPRHPILALGATADGRHLAFTIRQRIWIFDRQTGTGRQIPDVAAIPYGLSWSPDGRHLLYTGTDHPGTNSAEGRFDHDTLRLRMLDVATGRSTDVRGTDSLIATSEPGAIREPAWAPDGARIAFSLNVATFEMRMLDDPLAGVGSPRTRRRQR